MQGNDPGMSFVQVLVHFEDILGFAMFGPQRLVQGRQGGAGDDRHRPLDFDDTAYLYASLPARAAPGGFDDGPHGIMIREVPLTMSI